MFKGLCSCMKRELNRNLTLEQPPPVVVFSRRLPRLQCLSGTLGREIPSFNFGLLWPVYLADLALLRRHASRSDRESSPCPTSCRHDVFPERPNPPPPPPPQKKKKTRTRARTHTHTRTRTRARTRTHAHTHTHKKNAGVRFFGGSLSEPGALTQTLSY